VNKPSSVRNQHCIHSVFEAQAASRPQHIAIKHCGEAWSYETLNRRANHLAACLRAEGIEHGDVVALSTARSVEMIIAIIATLKAGGSYLPLDRANPISRNMTCMDVAKVALIISDDRKDQLVGHAGTVFFTDQVKYFGGETDHAVSIDSRADDPAYVIFTSGSTGSPKGVVVPHRAVVRLVIDTNYVRILPEDCILQLAPTSFDASTFEIWGALLNGATLALYSGSVLDPNILRRELLEYNVSIMWLTAALFHLIGDKFTSVLKTIKVLLAGGDVLYSRVIHKVLDEVPGIVLVNGYGPTENTTFTCCHRITAANPPGDSVPIGTAISGTEVVVLDEVGQPVKAGDVGELYTSGLGVALGYLDEDQGGGGFFLNSNVADGLIYRTGDLVRENHCGELEFVGRRDNQVKVRGFRVSLEEITFRITAVDYVEDALVFLKQCGSGDQILVAYVHPSSGAAIDSETLRRQLAVDLPEYMVPDRFVFGGELPVTANGKLDREGIQARMANLGE
jgi:amino acid adenylation domain-containing protein